MPQLRQTLITEYFPHSTTFEDLPADIRLDIFKRASYLNCHANCVVCGVEEHNFRLPRCGGCGLRCCRKHCREARLTCVECDFDILTLCPDCFSIPRCDVCDRSRFCEACGGYLTHESGRYLDDGWVEDPCATVCYICELLIKRRDPSIAFFGA